MCTMRVINTCNRAISDSDCEVVGDRNVISGQNVRVRGHYNVVNGPRCDVTGNHNQVNGMACKVKGEHNQVNGMGCHVQGKNNNVTGMGCFNTSSDNTNILGTDQYINGRETVQVITNFITQPNPVPVNRGRIISVSGVAGAGKDTICNILQAKCGFICLSFAGPLKAVASELTGWPYETLLANTEERRLARNNLPTTDICGKTYNYREFLEYVGTDVIRKHMGEDIWVNILVGRVKKLVDQGQNVCISDARFINEIDSMRDLFAECWCVWRKPSDLEDMPGVHVSERQFLQRLSVMKLVENTGSLNDLERRVLKML
jgi:dephospho-CoA kinase